MRKLKDFKTTLGHDKLLVGEFFKGYGSQSLSLDDIGIPNKVTCSSEIDPDAIISYASARFSQEKLNEEILNLTDEQIREYLMSKNIGYDFQKNKSSIPRMKKDKLHKLYNACILTNEMGDISIINPNDLPDFDLMTYSSPCTDYSVAGKQKGGDWTCKKCNHTFNPIESHFKRICPYCHSEEIEITRSSLLFECYKIIKAKKPKFLLLENVKNLVGKKFKPTFDIWCNCLEELGYTNYWQVLNAKDYGVPQNRERVFMVSILGEHDTYKFPTKQELKLRLKDILEDRVDEKYYINNEKAIKLIEQFKVNTSKNFLLGGEQKNQSVKYDGISTTLTSAMGCGGGYVPMTKVVAIPCDSTLCNPKELDVANCITARYDAGIQNKPSIGVAVVEGYSENTNEIMQVGNYMDKEEGFTNPQCGRVYSGEGISPTLNTIQGGDRQPKVVCEVIEKYRIRKLTPRECFRLMGISDETFDKIQASGISNSQLYKQAGNSIVKNVLDAIFTNLFFEDEQN